MGKEATCRVRHNGREWTAKAHLDSDELTIRGENRMVATLQRQATCEQGWIRVPTPEGDLELELGEQADKWAAAIRNPPSLLEKLGIKEGMAIAALNFADVYWIEGRNHANALDSKTAYDAILTLAEKSEDLQAISKLSSSLSPKGMLWIIFPKGRKDITETQVFAAGKAAGLVDVKVCRFNALLTGLKFVRRKGA